MTDRRKFLQGLTAAGAATVLRPHIVSAAAEPGLETTRLRLVQRSVICSAPIYVAEALLRDEGFTDVAYVKKGTASEGYQALATGEIDMLFGFAATLIVRMDAGDPITMISGGHVGCLQLFATQQIRTLHDLKGKTIASADNAALFLASIFSYVGLDPRRDITLVTRPDAEATKLFIDGKVDAVMVSPPFPQELAEKKIGRIVLDTTTDRPWSQYFCCMVAANREFVRKNPRATRNALRAILKANDLCALEPDRVVRDMVEKGFAPRYDHAFQAVRDLPYGKWRQYDPNDTVRFYALRLHEIGMIKSSPQKILAQGTDWRFLNELKKELKG
jgi:NitT/TauT family transport system substrate-binding protein